MLTGWELEGMSWELHQQAGKAKACRAISLRSSEIDATCMA